MPNLENGFSTPEEYVYWEKERLLQANAKLSPEVEIEIEELYILMCLLKSRRPNQQVAKVPARVKGVKEREKPIAEVSFTTLPFNHGNVNPSNIRGVFHDGYFQPRQSTPLWLGGLQVTNAYLRDEFLPGVPDNAEVADVSLQIEEADLPVLALPAPRNVFEAITYPHGPYV